MTIDPSSSVSFVLNGRRHTLIAADVERQLNGVAPEPLRKHAVRINATWYPVMQAFEASTGVPRREFISHAARRHLAALGFEVHGKIEARDPQVTRSWPAENQEAAVPEAPSRDVTSPADLLLVTCVKEKLPKPAAAKDLYISPLFRKERVYAETTGLPWFILSAEHGLVDPDEWLAPYERYLPDTPATYRRAWGRWVAERLELLAGPLAGRAIEIHAGSSYIDPLHGPLTDKGATILQPLAGLTMGQRLAWYRPDADQPLTTPSVADEHAAAAEFRERLLQEENAVTPAEFLAADRSKLDAPGLYSWWVDEAGAADLTRGLGHHTAPGLIYAGLAGATRWPSGKRSNNTLWSRIAGMHLGRRHEFSTFRRTLGAILAACAGSDTVDEDALTQWMHAHLKVLAIPYDDPDTLGHLESDVLRSLDPPLNLMGMPRTPLRVRLSAVRSRVTP